MASFQDSREMELVTTSPDGDELLTDSASAEEDKDELPSASLSPPSGLSITLPVDLELGRSVSAPPPSIDSSRSRSTSGSWLTADPWPS